MIIINDKIVEGEIRDCVTLNTAFDFFHKDKDRVIRKVNGIRDHFHKKQIIMCMELSFDSFKRSYISFESELKDIRMQLEKEHGEPFFLSNLEYKEGDSDCGIRGSTMIIEAYFDKKN